jgi:hypothetical protein
MNNGRASTATRMAVSLAVTALDFIPDSWGPFVVGNLLAGLIYGLIGALAGALVGRLGGAYLMFFLSMMDRPEPDVLRRLPARAGRRYCPATGRPG